MVDEEAFVDVIQKKVDEITGGVTEKGTVYYAATVCVKELIINLLQEKIIELSKSGKVDDSIIENIRERISIMNDPTIGPISPLQLSSLPQTMTKRNIVETPVGSYPEGEPSYTAFLNEFFQVNFADTEEDEDEGDDESPTDSATKKLKWRPILSEGLPADQKQCVIALGGMNGKKVREYQNSCIYGSESDCIECYICENIIKKENSTMQCEHILSFATAISHFGLIETGEYSGERFEQVLSEYAWSHACCNGIKKNYEFIKFAGGEYVIDEKAIDILLQKIAGSSRADCQKITPKNGNKIKEKVDKLVSQINEDMIQFPSIEFYIAFTTFKLLSAITKKTFMDVIISDVRASQVLARMSEKERKEQERIAAEAAELAAKQEAERRIQIENFARGARLGPREAAREEFLRKQLRDKERKRQQLIEKKRREGLLVGGDPYDDSDKTEIIEIVREKLDVVLDEDLTYDEIEDCKNLIGLIFDQVFKDESSKAKLVSLNIEYKQKGEALNVEDVSLSSEYKDKEIGNEVSTDEFPITDDNAEEIKDESLLQQPPKTPFKMPLFSRTSRFLPIPVTTGRVRGGSKRKTSKRMKRTKNRRTPQKSNKKRTRRHRKK
jgi:hypothetical protein